MWYVYALPPTDVSVDRATLHGRFGNTKRSVCVFQWKVGLEGSVYQYATYGYPHQDVSHAVIGLDQNALCYTRMGYYYYATIRWSEWITFYTLSCKVTTLEPTDNQGDSIILHGSWVGYLYFVGFEWKIGLEGEVESHFSGYKQTSPYQYFLDNLEPLSVYYHRFGIRFVSHLTYDYFIWGQWVMFHNLPYVYHFRAYAIGDDGLKHIGEDLVFLPKF